jgi:hypothetical protein
MEAWRWKAFGGNLFVKEVATFCASFMALPEILQGQTCSTRPLCDAAVAWLTARAQDGGRVAIHLGDHGVYYDRTAAVNRVRREAGNKKKFAWKRNGLRHSLCSYLK